MKREPRLSWDAARDDQTEPARCGAAMEQKRLAVASRLARLLAQARHEEEIARTAVAHLRHSFDYFLAAIQRLDQDRVLRVVGAEGPWPRLSRALPREDRAVWATALYAGLRLGELQALRWSDVDFERGLIRIE